MKRYHEIKRYKEIQQIYEAKKPFRVKCKCGHTLTILDPRGYQICSWCRNYAFINEEVEFKYRMKEKLNKERRK